jgi:hypothetical protein
MPTPTIPDGELFFNATTYTGNGSSGRVITVPSINNVGFAWVKLRSGSDDHRLANTVTGGNRHLKSNNTDPESTGTTVIQAFSSNTFTVGSDVSVNGNGSTYIAWTWADGGAAVTNTAGTISSQVSANTTSGFSVVTYTGNGTGGATIGHGLGAKPSFFIIKKRTNSGTAYGWYCYSSVLGATNHLVLNTTADSSASSFLFNDTEPSSSAPYVFTVGTSPATNEISIAYVAYCWTPIAGYSAFGSYTGNGSTTNDGPFVYLGFRPKFIMGKRSDSTGGWWMFDTSINSFNLADNYFYAQAPDGEFLDITTLNIDILSNGFKVRSGTSPSTWINASGGTYIYMAFAENPFKYANAR